jgi:hypothetical protein
MPLVNLTEKTFKHVNRREAISRVAVIMGGALVSTEFLLSGCKPGPASVNIIICSEDQVKLLDEIGDTILPATKTPGAKATQIGSFMALLVKDCYTSKDQRIFMDGLSKLDNACKKKYNKAFMDCSHHQRTDFLITLDNEQKAYTKTKKEKDANHYFRMMKELTLLGYFTSETGCTQAMRYLPIPGKFEGDIPYKKGDKAWATS